MYINLATGVGVEEKSDVAYAHKKVLQGQKIFHECPRYNFKSFGYFLGQNHLLDPLTEDQHVLRILLF